MLNQTKEEHSPELSPVQDLLPGGLGGKFTKKFFNFKSPYELLVAHDVDLLNEIYHLYPWQVEILERFSSDPPIDDILRMAVIAANGSGKSQYIIAPCASWIAVSFDESYGSVTSSSAHQLDTQTEPAIDRLCSKMNETYREFMGGQDCWHYVRRSKQFLVTKSPIDLFATDEPKRAEGKHPIRFGGEFAIFVDEGKSIEEGIYDALTKCTGATRRLDVSSAGGTSGHFYEICTKPELGWWVKKITAFDCPHIRRKEIENAILKYGLHDPVVRATFFSEFTSVNEEVVIMRETLENCFKCFYKIIHDKPRAGLDLSAGRAETAFSVWNGNEQVGLETIISKDTSLVVREVIDWMGKYKWIGLKPEHVFADDGGVGRGILDNFREKGYEFNRVMNQWASRDKSRYRNRGTENWWNYKLLLEHNLIKPMNDKLLNTQTCNRRYSKSGITQLLLLEAKEEAIAKGRPSPDRADANILAWCDTTVDDLLGFISGEIKKSTNGRKRYTPEQIEEMMEDGTKSLEELFGNKGNRINNFGHSIDSLLSKQGFEMKGI